MSRKWLIVPVIALLFTAYWVGSVHAQDNEGSLLEDGYPIEQPTEEPTLKPTQNPKPSKTASPTAVPTENTPAAVFGETTPEPFTTSEGTNAFCDGTQVDPALMGLSVKFGVSYDEILGYSCELGARIGEITLAYQTVIRMDGVITADEFLELRRKDQLSWGEIWQKLGSVGSGPSGDQSTGLIWDTGWIGSQT